MKKLFTLYIYILFACTTFAQVNVSARLDSVGFFVGQQDGIELQVVMDAGQHLQLPRVKKGDMLVPNVEVVDVLNADTQSINDGKRLEIKQKYIITAWDSSLYSIPPFKVLVDKKPYETKPLAIKVLTLDIDTTQTDRICPPRPVQTIPFCWDDWKYIVYSWLIAIILIAVTVYVWHRTRKGKTVFSFIRVKKKLPPHQVAITEIENIKSQKPWTDNDSKEYYTRLTDVLREYIQDRYGFSAMELTSNEIIQNLIERGDEQSLNELRSIFATADLVKFARFQPYMGENDSNLMAALRYVNETKPEEDIYNEPEPEVIKQTDHARLRQVIIAQTLITITVIICICLTGWIIYRLYDLLS